MDSKNIKTNKLNIDLPMTIISVALLFGFVFFMVIKPEETLNGVTAAFNGATQVFGTTLMIFTFVTFLLAVYLAFGKYGKIKLGDCDPEYSTFSYIAMMALAALASAALFWSFTEWAYYYAAPGLGIEAYSTQAAEISLGYAFFHWGFATQAPYVLTGVAIAYAVYNKKVKFMKVSSVCEEMMGNFKYKRPLGKIIDLSVIFCIVGALGCTLGLAVPLASGALKQVFGLESTFIVQVSIVVVIALIFTLTSFIGTAKGMKNLSNFSAILCIAFLAFVLFAGPTIFILKNFVSSMGWMVDSYVRMSFFTDPIEQTGFTESWTLFFQAFCLTYTALMGIFVAKISKGRTIKQVSLCCFLGVSAGVWAWFAIDGGFAIHSEVSGAV
ncbi:MAG: BCCT family transporter, partial [Anaerovorax sp.]